jgi:serine/threonine protein kinase
MGLSPQHYESFRAALADRYTLEGELGAGGMAVVYRAHDVRHGRTVAIKVLTPNVASALGTERFLREIRLCAQLTHPHIVPLFDSGELVLPLGPGVLYYVMPLIAGETLRQRLNRERTLPVADAVRIASDVAGALDYAHRAGFVHRDVKPENILLQGTHAMVADFGIGKALSEATNDAGTQAGVIVGTPTYLSPEQASGELLDGRSDLYSLACVLYEALAGEPPFTGSNMQAVIAKRFTHTPVDVMSRRDGVARPVARALHRALSRLPIDRHDTVGEFLADLSRSEGRASASDIPERSIAILPFANLSADPENEYFADGITEEILTALTHLSELKVAGRTSSFSFKGQKVALPEIAERLKVRTILEGSVRRSGKRVRITAQLLDAADGYQLWSERYDREIEDVFAVQDEIASAIAKKLETTLLVSDGTRSQRATRSIEAYEAYLKGRQLLSRRGKSIVPGLECMERALQLDPEYGLAWAGLAEGYAMLGYYSMVTPELARTKAVPAAENAVRFAPDVAEAHCALGIATLLFEWNDRERTAAAFKRGMELNPYSPQGATWYYLFYLAWAMGREAEGLSGMKALQARDPLSAYLCGMLAILEASLGHAESMLWVSRALTLDPDAFLSLFAHQIAAGAGGDWPGVLAASEALFAAGGRASVPLVWYCVAKSQSGDRAGARQAYDELVARSNNGESSSYNLACLAAELGLDAEAESWARKAIAQRDPTVFAYGAGRLTPVAALRRLPFYDELMREVNWPAELRR